MKKVSFILGALFLLTVAMTSCKKDYTCVCTVGGISVNYTIANTTKSDAKTKCDTYVSGTTVCELK
jgi:hypothetical protein